MKIRAWCCCFGVAALLQVAPVSAEIIEEMAANVNGELITASELAKREAEVREDLQKRYTGVELDQALTDFIPAVLADLINERLLYQRAERMGLDFNQVFRSTVDNIKKQNKIESNAELKKLLQQQGSSMDEFRENLLKYNVPDIMINIEVRQKIVISDADIQSYYDEHIDSFARPDIYSFREIALLLSNMSVADAQQKAEELVEQARGGADFIVLLEENSQAPSKDQGGLVEDVPAPEMAEKIREALKVMDVGEISAPVVLPRAVMIFKLERKEEAHVQSVEQVRNRIDGVLRRERLKGELTEYLKGLWAKNQIEITPKYEARYATDLYR